VHQKESGVAAQAFCTVVFKSEAMSGVDYKRFVRYFYDPTPKYDDMSGTSIWFLGKEYAATPPKPVSTTEREADMVDIESSVDSHDPSDVNTSTTDDSQQPQQQTSSFDDAQHVSGENVPSLSNDPADGGWPQLFLDDFESRIWMTYRSNFPPIPRSQDPSATSGMTFSVRLRNLAEREGFSSDTGWGCMIRSGQSLLANALIILHLGREWRRNRQPTPTSSKTTSHPTEASILSLFADDPSAPFSIHRFVQHGATACGKHPGQWFGPSATASCIKELSTEAAASGLRVYVNPAGSEVFEDRFLRIASSSPNPSSDSSPTINPTLILLGIRLGLDRITPVYHEALKSSLTYPQSIGIAGGRPSSSHYFVGCQGDLFLYLDPHETRAYLPYHPNTEAYTPEQIDSAHTRRLRGLRISEMDPSMLIGFLIRNEEDWEDWKRRIKEVKGKSIVQVYAEEPPSGEVKERKEAVDEVETFDDEAEEGDDAVTVTGKEEEEEGERDREVVALEDGPRGGGKTD
jgi:cysteine protease ATG4